MEAPVVKAQMLIRKPAETVFAAFADPAVTTNFWFTKSSGPLSPGASVQWEWEYYGARADVVVTAFEQNRRLAIEWGPARRPVEWTFDDRGDGTTLVTVTEHGFAGTDDERLALALDSMGGFTSLLAGAKAWVEHGLALGLVPDQHPDAHVKTG